MRHLLSLAVILIFSLSVHGQEDIIITDEIIKVNFNSNLDLADLIDIKTRVDAKGTTLDYTEITLDDKQIVVGLSFTIDSHNGDSGSGSNSPFGDGEWGFFVDNRPGAKISTLIGKGLYKVKNK